MADTANTAPAGGDNPSSAIIAEADKVQAMASRIVYLARAMNRLADDLLPARSGEGHREAADNLIVFAEMAEETAATIRDAGERIECLGRAAGRP